MVTNDVNVTGVSVGGGQAVTAFNFSNGEKALDFNGEALLVEFPFDCGTTSGVYYFREGVMMTLYDWQGDYPRNFAEVPDFEWVCPDGKPAIIVDVLPRAF